MAGALAGSAVLRHAAVGFFPRILADILALALLNFVLQVALHALHLAFELLAGVAGGGAFHLVELALDLVFHGIGLVHDLHLLVMVVNHRRKSGTSGRFYEAWAAFCRRP